MFSLFSSYIINYLPVWIIYLLICLPINSSIYLPVFVYPYLAIYVAVFVLHLFIYMFA